MIYRFRVILDAKEDVFRDIEINSENTLEEFHNSITQAFGFEGNEMASFYVSNEQWEQGEEIALFDLSEGMDSIRIMNETSLDDLAEIGRRSKFILGGDTGPMHIVSYLEIPIIMFFSGQSLFDLVSPRGQNVTLIHEKSLRDLKADHVIKLINSHTDIR